jgi:hypothetical protein
MHRDRVISPGGVRAVPALLAAVALVTLLARADSGDGAAIPPASPLTNEDIVRMVASGTPERDILEAIRTRSAAFDVADDMVSELKLAGVSGSIVAAMAQKAAEGAPAAAPAEPPARGRGRLVVILNPGAVGPRTLKLPAWADEEVKLRLKLPKENEQRQVKDLAVFLACSSPEHVPDLWRSKTPLGRDMVSVPRHEMLAFIAGDTPAGKPPRLTLPGRIDADVDDTEPHDLILGVAARIGDRWVPLAFAKLPKATIGEGQKPLAGRIERAGRAFDFKIELAAQR